MCPVNTKGTAMGYGQGDDLADAYAALRTAEQQLEEVKPILLQAALGENITADARAFLEKHFLELTTESQPPKKKWE